jgi:hypothetical protein
MRLAALLRPAAGPLTAAVAIATAAVLWLQLPANTDIYAPFDVRGVIGTPVSGRAVTATVTGVRIAPQLTADSVLTPGPLPATGTWLIVDATVQANRNPELPHAELLVGPNTYRPSDRLPPATALGSLMIQPGIAQRGAWVFDVAPALLHTYAADPLTLRVWAGDGRLDSRLLIRIGLTDPRVSEAGTAALSRTVGVVS